MAHVSVKFPCTVSSWVGESEKYVPSLTTVTHTWLTSKSFRILHNDCYITRMDH
jgi:hypothetical protein